MYGEYNPYLVYGFSDDRGFLIDDEVLEEHGIECFFEDVVRNHGGTPVYGIQAVIEKGISCTPVSFLKSSS